MVPVSPIRHIGSRPSNGREPSQIRGGHGKNRLSCFGRLSLTGNPSQEKVEKLAESTGNWEVVPYLWVEETLRNPEMMIPLQMPKANGFNHSCILWCEHISCTNGIPHPSAMFVTKPRPPGAGTGLPGERPMRACALHTASSFLPVTRPCRVRFKSNRSMKC